MTTSRETLLTLRAGALRRAAALDREFAAVAEAAGEPGTDDEHDPEGATLAFERQHTAALLAQTLDQVAEIDAALGRLDDGTYGTCVSCGQPVGEERLAARPAAATCVRCARLRSRGHARPPALPDRSPPGCSPWRERITCVEYPQAPVPAFLFDLDGTLIDSVYQHVIAWRAALSGIGIDLSVWRIHRRIGMSGGLFVQALLRETGRTLSAADIEQLQQAHAAEYRRQLESVNALPGARELLGALTAAGVRWAIATSGYAATARSALGLLGLPEDTPMVTRDLVRHAKPDPDLFLAAAALLDVEPRHAMVVGDSVWDLLAARRAGALGIGLQSGGYGREEPERAGAYRVYADPAEMLARLDEAGVRFDEPDRS